MKGTTVIGLPRAHGRHLPAVALLTERHPRIQYSDRALERLLARDVPSADVTAKDAAVCQSAPTTHPHNVPGILVSPFFFLYIP